MAAHRPLTVAHSLLLVARNYSDTEEPPGSRQFPPTE